MKDSMSLDFAHILLCPGPISQVHSRREVKLEVDYPPHLLDTVPIIIANTFHTGTMEMARKGWEVGRVLCALHKYYTREEMISWKKECERENRPWFYTMGIEKRDEKRLGELDGAPLILIDVANGYMQRLLTMIERVRERFPHSTIMAGNVCEGRGARRIINAGADIVKVGIGSGAICTTRKVTGVGMPQISALLDTKASLEKIGGKICLDGGMTRTGDLCKAFALGADFVMSGTLFAGMRECEGEIVEGKMVYYGMSSRRAMEELNGGMEKYKAEEGRAVMVDFQGGMAGPLSEMLGGIRSSCSYLGRGSLRELIEEGANWLRTPVQESVYFKYV